MSNIIGEGFSPEIISQIKVRQKKYGSSDRSNETLQFLNNRTGWCKLVSSVFLEQNIRNLGLVGNELAKKYVLFNGITNESSNKPYAGVTNVNSIHNQSAYGIGGLDFGLKPMMGIKSAVIKTETRGSLKTATIQIRANNKTQFDIIDTLYLRLGFNILLEWGHSSYFDNQENYISDNPNSIADDFLDGKYIYDEVLPKIQELRLKSNGNYNAIIGKVFNFNWTYNKDGSYDITLFLRSLGDVIESLKVNLLLPSNENTSLNQTEQGSIVSYKDANEISKQFYTASLNLTSKPLLNDFTTILQGSDISFLDKNTPAKLVVNYISQKYKNADTQYFVRLGHLLNIIQKDIIPETKNKSIKLIKIDTDIDTNIIYLQNRQISTDPRICLFKCSFDNNVQFLKYAEDFKFTENNNWYGKIMNCYFNTEWVLNQIEELKDEDGKTSLYNFLNKLCEGWNKATGYFNKLEPIIDETKNEIKIIDSVSLPDRDSFLKKFGIASDTANFDLYGYKNNTDDAGFIRNISFMTQIPSSLATMITIGSTSNGYITGQDSTALSRMNNGMRDRTKSEIVLPSNPNPQPTSSSLEVEFAGPIKNFTNFINKLGSINNNQPVWDIKSIEDYSNTVVTFLEYDQATKTQKAQIESQNPESNFSSPNIGFLPFDLQLSLDGLSGIKIYQKYLADTSFLPSNYPTTLEFLVKGITDVIENNEWITNIESLAVPKNPFGSGIDNGSNGFRVMSFTPTTTRPKWVPVQEGKGARVTSLPQNNRVINGISQPHYGLDVAAEKGVAIISPVDGIIDNSAWNPGGGGFGKYFVIIRDTNYNFHIFGHNSSRAGQIEGQSVKKGDVIAYIGNEGSSTGNHLHYEIRKGSLLGPNVDPVLFINNNIKPTNAQLIQ